MVTIVAGLIYFVSPVNLVLDFLPGGLVDDAVVFGWVIRTVKEELAAFIEWSSAEKADLVLLCQDVVATHWPRAGLSPATALDRAAECRHLRRCREDR